MTEPDAAAGDGVPSSVADRLDRWLVPVVRWVRRTLSVPIASGLLSAGMLVAASLASQGAGADGAVLAVGAVAVMAVPVVGLGLFVRILGGLQRLPATLRGAPSRMGDLKEEMAGARAEFGDLRRKGVLGLPGGLRWLRRTLNRLDAVGVGTVAGAVAALHPVRLAWIVALCWFSLVAFPVAVVVLTLALQA